MRLVVVTGVSGAGKSTALRALEDLGFYAVDNLPLPLVPKLIELLAGRPDVDRAALGIDARSGDFLDGAASIFADLRKARAHRRGAVPGRVGRHPDRGGSPRRAGATRCRTPTSARASRPSGATLARPAPGGRARVVDTGTLNVHVLRAPDPGALRPRRGRRWR